MKLRWVEASNFLSWKRISFDLDTPGLHLVGGPVGAGKTALLLNVPEWVLYRTLSGKDVSADAVVRTGSDGQTWASVEFEAKGCVYLVNRFRKHAVYGDSVSLYRRVENSYKEFTAETNQATDQRIRDLVGLSPRAFRSLYSLPEDAKDYFSKFTDRDQKDLLREYLGLAIFERARRLALDRSNRIGLKLENLDGKLEAARMSLERLRTLVSAQNFSREGDIADVEAARGVAQKQIEDLSVPLYEREREVVTAQQELDRLRRKHEQYGVPCPSCGARMKCPQCPSLSTAEGSMLGEDVERARTRVLKLTMVRDRVRREKVGLQAAVAGYDRELKRLRSSRLGSLVDEEIESSLRLIKDLGVRYDKVETRQQDLAFWLKGYGKTGAELDALRSALAQLNILLRTNLGRLFPSARLMFSIGPTGKITHKFTSDRLAQSLGGTSKGQRRLIDIAVGLSLQGLLQDYAGVTVQPLVLDEVFDGLDEPSIRAVIFLLQNLSQSRPVWVISHNEYVRQFFPDVVDIALENGVSTLRGRKS